MNSSPLRQNPLVAALLWRSMLLGVFMMLLIHLLVKTHLYATTLVTACIIALLAVDINRVVVRTSHLIEAFLDTLIAGTSDNPDSGRGRFASQFQRATTFFQSRRVEQQSNVEYLQALIDTVQASLFVIREDQTILLANRAAQLLAQQPANKLADIYAIGVSAASTLSALAPGSHRILRLDSGQQVFASAAQLTMPGDTVHKLISLQRLVGELDAIELKAWDDMATVLTHEIMNSLTPIASLSEGLDQLLRSSGQTDDLAASLEAIKRRSLGLMNFVERYRQVTELPKPVMQRVNLGELLVSIERLMAVTFNSRKINYCSSTETSDIFISTDPQLLEQALINLVKNASDAVTAVDDPRVQISCRVENDRIAIAVSDNGVGLSQEQKENLFVPFYTTKVDGSGIGLNLVRRIAYALEGKLTVNANQPRGSVFTLTLKRFEVI